jgi:hypothetical protein
MPRTHELRLYTAIIAAAGMCACAAPKQETLHHSIVVSALSDDGAPLPGVTVTANARELGETGPAGGLVFSLTAPAGKVVELEALCPTGYRSPDDSVVLRLGRVAHVAEEDRLNVTIECRPMVRQATVLVRTPGHTDLPITLHGNEVARTDELGLAHVLLSFAPNTRFQIGIDTSGEPRLRPRNPIADFELEDLDQVFVLEQQFEQELPKKRYRKRAKKKKKKPMVEFRSLDKSSWSRF